MKGLILKDLLILKNQMRSVLIIILGFILLSLWMENYFYIAFIIPFYIVWCNGGISVVYEQKRY